MITVAGQMFIEYEKELDNLDKIIKEYENYIRDNKIRNDLINKVCGDNVKDICSENDEVYKNNSINRFKKFFYIKKREMLSNKYLFWKKVSKIFH